MSEPCEHVALAKDVTPSGNGCVECLEIGDEWVHLRLCMMCGHVGCCNDSKNKHAEAHWRANPDHPLMRSFEPDEDWWWCFEHDRGFYVKGAPPAPSHT